MLVTVRWAGIALRVIPVADPGFPRGGGANHQGGEVNLIFGQKFPENAWKWKNWDPEGGGARPQRPPPLDPPVESIWGIHCTQTTNHTSEGSIQNRTRGPTKTLPISSKYFR